MVQLKYLLHFKLLPLWYRWRKVAMVDPSSWSLNIFFQLVMIMAWIDYVFKGWQKDQDNWYKKKLFHSCLNKGLEFLFISFLKWHLPDGGIYFEIFSP